MIFDFSPYFKRYEDLTIKCGQAFDKIKEEYPDCVKCVINCSDCCHALFDLTLIEAIYINHYFNEMIADEKREEIINLANIADRSVYKIKKKAHQNYKSGESEDNIIAQIGKERVRCPFLDQEDQCSLYSRRPITCRLYGIPTSIGGKGHTCGESNFVEGVSYPTVNLDIIHNELYMISSDLVKAIKTPYVKMSDLLVPLSMAILTEYSDEYFGLAESKEKSESEEQKG